MTILAIETSTEMCSVALKQHKTLYTKHAVVGRGHAKIILNWIDELLRESGCHRSDINTIIIGTGPGSFTGLRISSAIAQGLSVGSNAKIYGSSSLLLFAVTAAYSDKDLLAKSPIIMVAQDAKMGEVYYGVYQYREHEWKVVIPDAVAKPENIPSIDMSFVSVGNAWNLYHSELTNKYSNVVCESRYINILPTADCLIKLFEKQKRSALITESPFPAYIRNQVTHTK